MWVHTKGRIILTSSSFTLFFYFCLKSYSIRPSGLTLIRIYLKRTIFLKKVHVYKNTQYTYSGISELKSMKGQLEMTLNLDDLHSRLNREND